MRTITAIGVTTIAVNVNLIRAIQQDRLQKELKGSSSSKPYFWSDSSISISG